MGRTAALSFRASGHPRLAGTEARRATPSSAHSPRKQLKQYTYFPRRPVCPCEKVLERAAGKAVFLFLPRFAISPFHCALMAVFGPPGRFVPGEPPGVVTHFS